MKMVLLTPLAWVLLTQPSISTPAFGQSDSNAQTYPTSQRIQIPEPCPPVAKWLAQGLAPGVHWQLLRYDQDLGTLTFKIVSAPDLTGAEARQYLNGKAKHVHMEQVLFTLRSLVSSTVSFGDNQLPEANSCTIATAFKYAIRDGTPIASNGRMETLLLQELKDRYAKRGLDY